MTGRLKFLDDFRWLAIAAMVVNHAGHYLTLHPVNYPIYLMIYLSVTLAAPIFLFVAGFSQLLSWQRFSLSGGSMNAYLIKCLKRAAMLILSGCLINILFFFDEPFYRSRVLFFLGVSAILAVPFMPLLKKRTGRIFVSILALVIFAGFQTVSPAIAGALSRNPIAADIFLSEFPLLPWFALYLVGLLSAYEYSALDEIKRKIFMKIGLAAGMLSLFLWVILSAIYGRMALFSFAYDLDLGGYWTPSLITWLWIFGWIMIGFFCAYFVRQDFPDNETILSVLGKNALAAYFIHFFIIRTVGESVLGAQLAGAAELALPIILTLIILWILLKSKLFAKLMAFARASLRAKIS